MQETNSHDGNFPVGEHNVDVPTRGCATNTTATRGRPPSTHLAPGNSKVACLHPSGRPIDTMRSVPELVDWGDAVAPPRSRLSSGLVCMVRCLAWSWALCEDTWECVRVRSCETPRTSDWNGDLLPIPTRRRDDGSLVYHPPAPTSQALRGGSR